MEGAKIIAADELLMEQLDTLNWEELWVKLVGRCVKLLKTKYSKRWKAHEFQEFSQDIVSEVIEKIFVTKTRNWNTAEYPDFEEFIGGVVDSHVNNTLKKKNHLVGVGDNEYILDNNSTSEPTGEDAVIADELRSQIYDALEKAGADDDELIIFECLASGITKPRDIRDELGMSAQYFQNVWRRLDRKREVIQEKLTAYGH